MDKTRMFVEEIIFEMHRLNMVLDKISKKYEGIKYPCGYNRSQKKYEEYIEDRIFDNYIKKYAFQIIP